MREVELVVSAEDDGSLAKNFLRKHGFSVRVINGLKRTCGLTRGGEILRTVDRVHTGDVVRVAVEERAAITGEFSILPNPALKAELVYEDDDVAVFSKPPEMPVHPSLAHADDTLANLYTALYPDSAFHALYRLDKNTSGLCVCAKNRFAAFALSEKINKTYYAIVDGIIARSGSIELPIGRTDDSIIKRQVREDGQYALTNYKPIQHSNGRTLLEIHLETGRTHQIRVHFSHIGYPLCGDDMYGGDCSDISRQALHCGSVEFESPVTGEKVSLTAPIPGDMRSLLCSDSEITNG